MIQWIEIFIQFEMKLVYLTMSNYQLGSFEFEKKKWNHQNIDDSWLKSIKYTVIIMFLLVFLVSSMSFRY